jgi:hypothetical protein
MTDTSQLSPREKLIKNIKAMLNKTTANGCSEEEELSSLAKARALIDAHEVTDAELKLTKEEGLILCKDTADIDPHNIKFFMCGAVSEFCDCTAWRDGRDRKIVFLGHASDAQWAAWLLDHLAAFVQKELVDHLMKDVAVGAERRKVINGFVYGITNRISERLRELCQPPAPTSANTNSRALVVIKQTQIKDKMKELGIHVRATSSNRQHDIGSYAAGHSAGERASFGRPVSGRAAVLRIGK